MKHFLLGAIFTVLTFQVFSQGTAVENNYSGLRPGMPLSPTSASLGFFSNYPVTQFTGVPDIKVPIYKLDLDNNLSIDISLSYNPNMVKVNTMSGWAGLGWALNASGVITRTVRDIADDQKNLGRGLLHPCTVYGNGLEPIYTVNAEDSLKTIGYDNDCKTANQIWRLLLGKGSFAERCDTNRIFLISISWDGQGSSF